MRRIAFFVMLWVSFFATNSMALTLSFTPPPGAPAIGISNVLASDISGNTVNPGALVNFVEMSVSNNDSQPVTFSMIDLGWGISSDSVLYTQSGVANFNQIIIQPNSSYVGTLIYGAGASYVGSGLSPSALGDFSRIIFVQLEFSVNGVVDYFDFESAGNSYLWRHDVTSQISNGGTAPVPEPTTALLFGTGLIGLAGISRKKK